MDDQLWQFVIFVHPLVNRPHRQIARALNSVWTVADLGELWLILVIMWTAYLRELCYFGCLLHLLLIIY